MASVTRYRPMYAPNGAVVAASPAGSQAGIDVLQQGGTAVDALVASIWCEPASHAANHCWIAALCTNVWTDDGQIFEEEIAGSRDLARASLGFLRRHGTRSFDDLLCYSPLPASERRFMRVSARENKPELEPDGPRSALSIADWAGARLLPTVATGNSRDIPGAPALDDESVGVEVACADTLTATAVDHRGTVAALTVSTSRVAAGASVTVLRHPSDTSQPPDAFFIVHATGQGFRTLSPLVDRLRRLTNMGGPDPFGARIQSTVESSEFPVHDAHTPRPGLAVLAVDCRHGVIIGCRHPRGGSIVAGY